MMFIVHQATDVTFNEQEILRDIEILRIIFRAIIYANEGGKKFYTKKLFFLEIFRRN